MVELQRLCLGGVGSKNFKKSYLYGQKIFLTWKEINNLISTGVFEAVAMPCRKEMFEERSLPPVLIARDIMMEKAWNNLKDDETWIMGMYGMGGVGKTALLEQLNNKLKGDHVKSCFQYCILFPEDQSILKEVLIEYWICEGYVDGKDGRERALNQGYEILGTLVRACLLLENGETKSHVKMHDVVREMSMWIASDIGNHNERCIVRAGAKAQELPKVKDWDTVRSMSLMRNNIEELSGNPDCPQRTFLQQNYKLVYISGGLFKSMPMLIVLDLSVNNRLNRLPEEIAELVSLRFLDLSHTSIARLPAGIQKLKNLLHLNLECMWRLESIAGISNLSSLRLLRLRDSKVFLDSSLTEELQLLEYLKTLTIKVSSILGLEKLFCAHKLVRCIQKVSC